MKTKDIILGIIISIVFLLFSVYGTKLIFEQPRYSDYCNIERPFPLEKENATEIEKSQELLKECQENYEEVREKYSQNLFLSSLIFSLIIIFISVLFIKVESVSGGLMLGSLMFIIYGTGGYWKYMKDLSRFLILGVSLAVLIWLGFWLSKRKI